MQGTDTSVKAVKAKFTERQCPFLHKQCSTRYEVNPLRLKIRFQLCKPILKHSVWYGITGSIGFLFRTDLQLFRSACFEQENLLFCRLLKTGCQTAWPYSCEMSMALFQANAVNELYVRFAQTDSAGYPKAFQRKSVIEVLQSLCTDYNIFHAAARDLREYLVRWFHRFQEPW